MLPLGKIKDIWNKILGFLVFEVNVVIISPYNIILDFRILV